MSTSSTDLASGPPNSQAASSNTVVSSSPPDFGTDAASSMSSPTSSSRPPSTTPHPTTTSKTPTSDDAVAPTTHGSSGTSGNPTSSHSTTTTSSSHSSDTTQHTETETTVSVTVVRNPSTIMSFVTVAPDSTLPVPVALTLTGADGRTTLSTPALVTLVSTSTDSNGQVVATTHVVANPTPDAKVGETSTRTGILKNEGALAGIFVAVGVVAALMIGGCIWLIRRRRKIARREAWISSIKPQPPAITPNPFLDPTPSDHQENPHMRSVDHDVAGYLWGSPAGNGANRSSDHSNDHSNEHGHATTSVYPDTYPILRPNQRTSPTTAYGIDPSAPAPGIGYGYAMRERNANVNGRPGMPEPQIPLQRISTPSLYPASLQGDDDAQYDPESIRGPPTTGPVTTRQLQRLAIPPLVPQRPISDIGFAMMTASAPSISRQPSTTAPPRPPRSHLRKNSTKSVDFAPLTPPDSVPSKTPSPISEARTQDILSRRTLLDVRSRALMS